MRRSQLIPHLRNLPPQPIPRLRNLPPQLGRIGAANPFLVENYHEDEADDTDDHLFHLHLSLLAGSSYTSR